MQEKHKGIAGRIGAPRLVRAVLAAAGLTLAVSAGGCGTAIETPLPDVKASASSSLTQAERAKAVEELNRKRATHEQDAEQQIQQSR
jgi:hypothetical protein